MLTSAFLKTLALMFFGFLTLSFAQGHSKALGKPPLPAQEKIDSLKRYLDQTLYSSVEQEFWKTCMREKQTFLQAERRLDSTFSQVDTQLRKAKIARLSPDSRDVQVLLERKFLLENNLEKRYLASADGHRCTDMTAKRKAKADQALEQNADYRRWKRQVDSLPDSTNRI